jgi:cytochrome b involved in lipid metabolism
MQTPPLADSGIFDVITGLPVHPLVVHVAVVLLPVSAVALIALVFLPRWRGRYGWLTLGGLTVGTIAAFVAKESGEALARRVGEPDDHAAWGDRLPPVALILLAVAIVWFVLDRRNKTPGGRQSPAVLGSGLVAAVLAVVATAMTVLVGHSGATAVWAAEISDTADTSAAASASPSGSATASASTASATGSKPAPAASSPAAFTMDAIKTHNSQASCWAAVDNKVYDLTKWIGAHPGGPGRIIKLCGTDATSAFHNEHHTEKQPADALAGFLLGPLS